MWDKRAKILSNHDGDTLTVLLDQGFGQTTEIQVRLFGVFAPELSQTGGKECQAFVSEWVEKNSVLHKWPFIVTTMRGVRSDKETVTLSRYVGVIETIDHHSTLNTDVQEYVLECGYSGGIGK